ncbi:MAG TPA: hypothetical protein PLU30_14705 [Verrucomicrobiae bacterium]|nr:hypothetical protein [Verrucomicrobiae bacterium]
MLLLASVAGDARAQEPPGWRAGVANARITPQTSLWMAGYASRKKPSEGVALDLNAKCLALDDGSGSHLVIVTLDLIGVPRDLRDAIERHARQKWDLPSAALLMNASHTHCGPELRPDRLDGSAAGDEERKAGGAYYEGLKATLCGLIDRAIGALAPAKLEFFHARAGFAMNRRRPTEKGYINAPYPDGPVDHAVPVLRVSGADGSPRALLFGYACHNTTLNYFKFCGDYAGFAQRDIEAAHPGVTALFAIGCGADQNPYPRGTEEQAQQHGRALANGVEAALLTVPKPIRGPLKIGLKEISLDFAPAPSRAELEKIAIESKDPDRGHARRLLQELDREGKIRSTYPYLVQVIRFDDDLTVVALAGEVVVDYSLRLKRELAGPAVWLMGYSNDVFGYVPSVRVLKEGGYEAGGAMHYTSLPGPFAESIEEKIIAAVHELAR